jgi:hypothetical protein
MQHDKARAIGEKIGERSSNRCEYEAAVGIRLDLRLIADRLLVIAAGGGIADTEARLALADLQILDRRRLGAPVPVADEIGDAAQNLAAAIADIAQRPIV